MALLKNRYEFLFFVNAVFANPNGDPDFGNRPRMDFETNVGIITDVALKSRIRAYMEYKHLGEECYEILIKTARNINMAIADAVLAVNNTTKMDKKDNKNPLAAAQYMCNKYWDVRTFGGVLSTGLNAGQVRGPVQLAMATSVDPISVEDITITRKAYADGDKSTLEEYEKLAEKLDDDKKRTMGTKQYADYGLYVCKGTVSAHIAAQTGMTEEDLEELFEAILQMYNIDASTSKMGVSVLSPVIVFKHIGTQSASNSAQNEKEAMLGCAPSYQLFELVSVKKKDGVVYPRNYTDYDFVLNASKLPRGVQIGFKTAPFSPVVYDDLSVVPEWLEIK